MWLEGTDDAPIITSRPGLMEVKSRPGAPLGPQREALGSGALSLRRQNRSLEWCNDSSGDNHSKQIKGLGILHCWKLDAICGRHHLIALRSGAVVALAGGKGRGGVRAIALLRNETDCAQALIIIRCL